MIASILNFSLIFFSRCECYEGYSGEYCDEGCSCQTFHTCVVHEECNSWGVCQEVSYDCVLELKSVIMTAGASGAALIVALLVAIAVCCAK